MGEPLGPTRLLPLVAVRHRVAAMLLARPLAEASVGDIVLWPHQRDAIERTRAAIAEFGGALLADDVGTGKTFVALAIASAYSAPLVVAPAALRDGWRSAGERVGRSLPFVSFESLSRGTRPSLAHDFIIVDEAHHARNPQARRYGELASLLADSPALLLSATPIHNRHADLVALLALFLGARAAGLDDAALARCVVRRGRAVLSGTAKIPTVDGPISIVADFVDDVTPDAILSLPPPVPAADAGTAGALLAILLLRQWSSSQGALLAGIRRRLAAAHALAASLDEGRYPTLAELSAWTLGDDAQQLAMTGLLAPAASLHDRAELREAVAAHIEGLRALRRAASSDPDIDRRRAARLHAVWRTHPGARSIAFTQFAETVDAYWRLLRSVPETCALTARGGRTAGGAISRAAALGSFAPGHRRVSRAERIGALLTTDLASEGLDLQDASVVIHLDLPWTPARLEQRVGRVVRPGSPHECVHVYQLEPPIRPARLLDIRNRLAAKLAAARATLGAVMPHVGIDLDDARDAPDMGSPTLDSPFARTHDRTSPTTAAERLDGVLRRWIRGPALPDAAVLAEVVVATAVAPAVTFTWLAVLGARRPRLVAARDCTVSDDPGFVLDVCALVDAASPDDVSAPAAGSEHAVVRARMELSAWLEARRGSQLAGVGDIAVVAARKRTLGAIARLAEAPASARTALANSTAQALAVASGTLGAGSERKLRALSAEQHGASARWLEAVADLASTRIHPDGDRTTGDALRALIVLRPAR